jgi:integrase
MAYLYRRGRMFYLKYYVAGRQKEVSLRTHVLQIAKERQRQFESAQAAAPGTDANPLPSRTPVAQVLEAYVAHIRTVKTAKSAQTEVYYLREVFGTCCPALTCTSRKLSPLARRRPSKASQVDGRRKLPIIEARCFEEITVAQVASFIDYKVRDQGLSPKTANHYRSIIRRVFNWASQREMIRLPGNVNPAAKVQPYRERAPEIRYLTLPQIDEKLHALRFKPQMQTMVAVLIYAGLRREELLWLQKQDVDLQSGIHGMIRVRAKTVIGEFWEPKTKVNRGVPISSALRTFLDRYTPRPSDGDWFFPSPDGKRWDTDNFSADLRAANAEAGLKWGCLDFRHTFGSQLAQVGLSLFKIATLMGHSPEICRRHYAALSGEVLIHNVDFPCYREQHGLTSYTQAKL